MEILSESYVSKVLEVSQVYLCVYWSAFLCCDRHNLQEYSCFGQSFRSFSAWGRMAEKYSRGRMLSTGARREGWKQPRKGPVIVPKTVTVILPDTKLSQSQTTTKAVYSKPGNEIHLSSPFVGILRLQKEEYILWNNERKHTTWQGSILS